MQMKNIYMIEPLGYRSGLSEDLVGHENMFFMNKRSAKKWIVDYQRKVQQKPSLTAVGFWLKEKRDYKLKKYKVR